MEIRERLYSYVYQMHKGQLWLAMLALVAMMGVTVVDVLSRFLFNKPLHGSYDLVESALVIFVFHGLGAVFMRHQHIVIDLIDSVVGERVVAALVWLSNLLATGLLVLVGWAMVRPAVNAYQYGDEKLELGLPLYLLWIVAMVGLAGTILCAVSAFHGRGKEKPFDEPFE